MFDPFYCLFSNAERAFRTYKTFGPGDDRLLMPDGVRLIWIGIIPNTCSGLCSSQWASKILREQHIGQRRSWPSGQVGKCICSNGIAHFVEFLRMPCSIWSKQLLPTCATLKLARWNWWHCLGCSSGMIVRLPLLLFFSKPFFTIYSWRDFKRVSAVGLTCPERNHCGFAFVLPQSRSQRGRDHTENVRTKNLANIIYQQFSANLFLLIPKLEVSYLEGDWHGTHPIYQIHSPKCLAFFLHLLGLPCSFLLTAFCPHFVPLLQRSVMLFKEDFTVAELFNMVHNNSEDSDQGGMEQCLVWNLFLKESNCLNLPAFLPICVISLASILAPHFDHFFTWSHDIVVVLLPFTHALFAFLPKMLCWHLKIQ